MSDRDMPPFAKEVDDEPWFIREGEQPDQELGYEMIAADKSVRMLPLLFVIIIPIIVLSIMVNILIVVVLLCRFPMIVSLSATMLSIIILIVLYIQNQLVM